MNILQPVAIDSTPSKILRYLSLQKWTRRIRVRGLKQCVKAIVLFNFFCYWLIALQDVFSAVIQSVHSFMPEGVMPCVLLFSSHFLLFLSVQTHCAATVLLTRKSKERTRTSGWKNRKCGNLDLLFWISPVNQTAFWWELASSHPHSLTRSAHVTDWRTVGMKGKCLGWSILRFFWRGANIYQDK